MLRRWIVILVGLCLPLSGARTVSAAVAYNVIDLGIASCVQTIAHVINATGDVAGTYYPSPADQAKRAFVYHNGTTSTMDALSPSAQMYAAGINGNGQIVGWAYTASHEYHGFLASEGTISDIGQLPGNHSNAYDVKANAINDNGQIVGYSYFNGTFHAFRYSNGTMTDLGTPPDCGSSCANAINSSGQVVGYGDTSSGCERAFLYSDGQMTGLGTLGGQNSEATAINVNGDVVGWSSTGSAGHAFLYSGGTMRDLGTLQGSTNSTAKGINSIGQVVGSSDSSGGSHAWIYKNGQMQDLNDLIDPMSGWRLIFQANAINDNGWIAGSAVNANSEQHAVLLVPIPEPSPLVLLGIGAIVLRGCAWRRRKHAG